MVLCMWVSVSLLDKYRLRDALSIVSWWMWWWGGYIACEWDDIHEKVYLIIV